MFWDFNPKLSTNVIFFSFDLISFYYFKNLLQVWEDLVTMTTLNALETSMATEAGELVLLIPQETQHVFGLQPSWQLEIIKSDFLRGNLSY